MSAEAIYSSVPDFVASCARSFSDYAGDELTETLLGPSEAAVDALREAINDTPPDDLDADEIAQYLAEVPRKSRKYFAAFLAAYLRWMGGMDGDEELEDAEMAFAEHDRLATVYSLLCDVYNSDEAIMTAFLNPLISSIASRLVYLSSRACVLATLLPREPTSARSIQDRTRLVLEKSFQMTSKAWDRESVGTMQAGGAAMPGDCVWPLASMLWRIYAERNLHNQANELRRTFDTLSPSEEDRIAQRSEHVLARDVAESWYWRGRLSCVLLDFRKAPRELEMAYKCATEDFQTMPQRRSIMSLLIPTNLLQGRLTSRAILDGYHLRIYIPLLHAFRMGNVSQWRRLLEMPANRDWLRRRNVWVMLYERGEILVWRNLFRRTVKMFFDRHPTAAPNRAPTSIFLAAARVALADSDDPADKDVELEDVLCILSSLIDQALIKGYLAHSQTTLVMRPGPGNLGGFPRLVDVEPRQVNANA